ncbi:proprotein convertase P-domain-containing protein [Amycolatopsis sp. H20-H5]|uniref:proprotein convertase P-domain-containing protein n=1 Tax=Amycolatopsis sp. H20-H5 TaxID=3046309 RepID=UPI002DB784F6|nr:proprotein convertase P-domain-containing protein [Amycolatopsis sp. H20-H5]MEC3978441.1 proprotein convertase P-domain-containing protein [Amycolatopsis sp. H20-H5]
MRQGTRIFLLAGAAALLPVLSLTQGSSAAQPTQPGQPPAAVDGIARDLHLSTDQARTRLQQQDQAQQIAAALPTALTSQLAGKWFDEKTGKLSVAVTSETAANAARAAGARPVLVARDRAELARLNAAVTKLVGGHVAGVTGWGVDAESNTVTVRVNRAVAPRSSLSALAALGDGVRIRDVTSAPVQQSGALHPGDPWWPGGESNCSTGFPATDSSGAKVFVTAGHCTNDANQAAYGASGQQNKLGTSNVGGTHSVNAHEGDMGMVSVTEAGWTTSPAVNTWGGAAVTVTGSTEPLVGQAVCHSGNTSHWQCGKVTAVEQTIDYGNNTIVDGLATTTACSLGGDSGGAWLAGDKALGLHSGGASSCSPGGADDQSIFQPVNEALRKWSLTLLTGGGGGDDTAAPSVPANLRSTGATSASVSLAWDASTDNVGVTGYDVYQGAALATSVSTTSATVSGLTADTAYSFTVKARDAAGNASAASAAVSARTSPGDTGGRVFTSTTSFPIRDFQVTTSALKSTATGTAVSPVSVQVNATHTCTEDLNITLVSPSGRAYPLQRYGGTTCHPFQSGKTFSVTANEQAAGTWTLRIGDNGPGDTGTLSGWSITL